MRRDAYAIVFDLDDTLYPYRRFKASGFVAAAAYLAATQGLDPRLGFAALHGASRGSSRGRELQACLEQHDLPSSLLPELIEIVRHHTPRLRLAPLVSRVLVTLRDAGWRIGVLTNGQPTIQARKIEALGLRPLVDVVEFATMCGNGEGKPNPEAFALVARRIAAPALQTVFVGNDERCDIEGARAAGMRVIRCDAWVRPLAPTVAHATTARLADIPTIAHALLEEALKSHAA